MSDLCVQNDLQCCEKAFARFLISYFIAYLSHMFQIT